MKLRVALVQTTISQSMQENLNNALKLAYVAAEQRPHIIAFPENFLFMGSQEELIAHAEQDKKEVLAEFQNFAKKHNTYVLMGSIKTKEGGYIRNRSYLLAPTGEIVTYYDKIHVFNARFDHETFTAIEEPGDNVVVTQILGVPVGIAICYDIRFPELFRLLRLYGAKLVLIPSMFTLHTGKDHWEVLLRARAIENQFYVAAPAIWGPYPPNNALAYGRSMIVDPWGIVIAQASDGPGVVVADLSLTLVDRVRSQMPVFEHRRPAVYGWPIPPKGTAR